MKKPQSSSILKATLPISLLAIAFVGAAPAVFATSAANCNFPYNCNLHGVTFDLGPPSPPTNPCTGATITDIAVTGNVMIHTTADGNHVTATIVGQATLTQDNGVTYTGHYQSWFGGNINKGGTVQMSGTDNGNLVGSDGTSFHLTDHAAMTITPAGVVTVSISAFNCH